MFLSDQADPAEMQTVLFLARPYKKETLRIIREWVKSWRGQSDTKSCRNQNQTVIYF